MGKFIAERGEANGAGIGGLVVRGNNLTADIVERVTSAKVSWSTSQIGQLTLRVTDDANFAIYRRGLFTPGGSDREGSQCDLGPLPFEVAAVELAPRGVDHELVVTARSLGAQKLRRRTGAVSIANTSWSAWAATEAAEVGLKFVGQDSQVLPNIARKAGTDTGGDGKPESTWDALQRGAKDIGFICFEAAGTLYFGQPTWLLARALESPDTHRQWWWRPGTEGMPLRELPRCRRTGDDPAKVASVVCHLNTSEDDVSAGMGVRLHDLLDFSGDYLVDAVTFDLAATTTVEVQASTAVDPVVTTREVERSEALTNGPTVSTGRPQPGVYGGERLDATQIGFCVLFYTEARRRNLPLPRAAELAIACARQESTLRNLNYGDRDSVGLFQQRPSQGWGSVAQIMNPVYAVNKFYDALVKVSGWQGMRETVAIQRVQRSGYPEAYQQWVPMARAVVAAMASTTQQTTTSAGAVAGTSVQAHAFVALAEKQAGDRYVFGAETRLADPDPSAFDCSELVEWAAYQVGVKIVDGSQNQRRVCKGYKQLTLAQAAATRGALLFTSGHVAISRGDGTTIEARGRKYGVVVVPNAVSRFVDAGLIPGMRYS